MPRLVAAGARHDLHGRASSTSMEQAAGLVLAPHTLMQRAGLAVARLALALAPHARIVWIAAGPGNNGGDGIEAALHLQSWGKQVRLAWLGDPATAPSDTRLSWARAHAAGVQRHEGPAPALDAQDLCIDALLGLGASRAPEGHLAEAIDRMNASAAPVLAIDLPSGLDPDTGQPFGAHAVRARWTLSLLSLKPGLFTGRGRDLAGEVWFCDLGVPPQPGDAMLGAAPADQHRPHASHKGSFGDVLVVGGAEGMTGAALLAASAAMHGGAGRVLVGLLDPKAPSWVDGQPELMLRKPDDEIFKQATVVCGCGGAHAVREHLPRLISLAPRLVLDADALNALAQDASLQELLTRRMARPAFADTTVMTPHPLEAARLLGSDTEGVQHDRLAAARALVERFGCVVVLKGSGSVIAAPGKLPVINPSGNARLATAGTGDVLAGMVAARLAGGQGAFTAACDAVYQHGSLADHWPADLPLTASGLARAARLP